MMPKGTRLFKLAKRLPVDMLLKRLNEAEPLIEERIIGENERVELRTIIRNVMNEEEVIRGELAYERLVPLHQLDGSIEYARDVYFVPFAFCKDAPFLIILTKKMLSETVASKLNKMLFGGEDVILKVYISRNIILEFLRRNPHTLKRCHWQGLRIPGADRAALAGPNVRRAPDFKRYDMYGERSYIVAKLLEYEWTIGIGREGSVVFFNPNIPEEDMVKFIIKRLVNLMIEVGAE